MSAAAMISAYLLLFFAGVSGLTQQVVNANLRMEIGSAWWAALISYAVGTAAMLAIILLLRAPPPALESLHQVRWMSWAGGLFGATFIVISILLLPRFGAATVIFLMIAGQMIGALVFDHFGLFGLPVHEMSLPRLAGAVLLIAGVALIRL